MTPYQEMSPHLIFIRSPIEEADDEAQQVFTSTDYRRVVRLLNGGRSRLSSAQRDYLENSPIPGSPGMGKDSRLHEECAITTLPDYPTI